MRDVEMESPIPLEMIYQLVLQEHQFEATAAEAEALMMELEEAGLEEYVYIIKVLLAMPSCLTFV